MIITIDGPSGSGKTTLALMIAKHLNFMCFSSGYVYRGLAYVLKNFYNYNTERMKKPDQKDINAIFQSGTLRYDYQHGLIKIFWVDDITFNLKQVEYSTYASLLAQHEVVRNAVKEYEKKFLAGKDVVIEGRACGSAWHSAEVKFYLDASIDVRAARFQQDQMKRGNIVMLYEAKRLVEARDQIDKNRTLDPLIVPDGAIVLDSSTQEVEKMLEEALHHIKMVLDKNKSLIQPE